MLQRPVAATNTQAPSPTIDGKTLSMLVSERNAIQARINELGPRGERTRQQNNQKEALEADKARVERRIKTLERAERTGMSVSQARRQGAQQAFSREFSQLTPEQQQAYRESRVPVRPQQPVASVATSGEYTANDREKIAKSKEVPGIYKLSTGEVIVTTRGEGTYVNERGQRVDVRIPIATDAKTGRPMYAPREEPKEVIAFNLFDTKNREAIRSAAASGEYRTAGSIYYASQASYPREQPARKMPPTITSRNIGFLATANQAQYIPPRTTRPGVTAATISSITSMTEQERSRRIIEQRAESAYTFGQRVDKYLTPSTPVTQALFPIWKTPEELKNLRPIFEYKENEGFFKQVGRAFGMGAYSVIDATGSAKEIMKTTYTAATLRSELAYQSATGRLPADIQREYNLVVGESRQGLKRQYTTPYGLTTVATAVALTALSVKVANRGAPPRSYPRVVSANVKQVTTPSGATISTATGALRVGKSSGTFKQVIVEQVKPNTASTAQAGIAQSGTRSGVVTTTVKIGKFERTITENLRGTYKQSYPTGASEPSTATLTTLRGAAKRPTIELGQFRGRTFETTSFQRGGWLANIERSIGKIDNGRVTYAVNRVPLVGFRVVRNISPRRTVRFNFVRSSRAPPARVRVTFRLNPVRVSSRRLGKRGQLAIGSDSYSRFGTEFDVFDPGMPRSTVFNPGEAARTGVTPATTLTPSVTTPKISTASIRTALATPYKFSPPIIMASKFSSTGGLEGSNILRGSGDRVRAFNDSRGGLRGDSTVRAGALYEYRASGRTAASVQPGIQIKPLTSSTPIESAKTTSGYQSVTLSEPDAITSTDIGTIPSVTPQTTPRINLGGPSVPIPRIPFFPLPQIPSIGGGGSGIKFGKYVRRQPRRYTPSAYSLALNIRGKMPRKRLVKSGLSVRPIVVPSMKRRGGKRGKR